MGHLFGCMVFQNHSGLISFSKTFHNFGMCSSNKVIVRLKETHPGQDNNTDDPFLSCYT